ncbi:Glucose-dependent insulinotropic receptor-like 2 [Homarus americanus]|uniref:Glucose-dependent insulinotropic receptor-like 2 n=1 Tax=Homarus americanus TaxID=6706 RepID=A0A8J5K894_HOMAM|nr:Glucose-dependent insulinotropic receptor-like 2 [Homarus americanus]
MLSFSETYECICSYGFENPPKLHKTLWLYGILSSEYVEASTITVSQRVVFGSFRRRIRVNKWTTRSRAWCAVLGRRRNCTYPVRVCVFVADTCGLSIVNTCGLSIVNTCGLSIVNTCGLSIVNTCGLSIVNTCGLPIVNTCGLSIVNTCGLSVVNTCGLSVVNTCGLSVANTCGLSIVNTCGLSVVNTCGLSVVNTCGLSAVANTCGLSISACCQHCGLSIVNTCGLSVVNTCGLSIVNTCGLSIVNTCGLPVVNTCGLSIVNTCGLSVVNTCGLSIVNTCGLPVVNTCGLSIVNTCGLSVVNTCGLSVVNTCGLSVANTCGLSIVNTCGLPVVNTCGLYIVNTCGLCLVNICGLSVVSTCGLSVVNTCGLSVVSTCGLSVVSTCGLSVVSTCGLSVVSTCGLSVVSTCGLSVVVGPSSGCRQEAAGASPPELFQCSHGWEPGGASAYIPLAHHSALLQSFLLVVEAAAGLDAFEQPPSSTGSAPPSIGPWRAVAAPSGISVYVWFQGEWVRWPRAVLVEAGSRSVGVSPARRRWLVMATTATTTTTTCSSSSGGSVGSGKWVNKMVRGQMRCYVVVEAQGGQLGSRATPGRVLLFRPSVPTITTTRLERILLKEMRYHMGFPDSQGDPKRLLSNPRVIPSAFWTANDLSIQSSPKQSLTVLESTEQLQTAQGILLAAQDNSMQPKTT